MAGRTLLAHADKLHALRVLSRSASFRRAAAALGVTPSALSQSVTVLEEHLGQTLVSRARGGVSATPFGANLLRDVGPALDAILAADRPPAASTAPATIRLGAYESIAVDVVPDLLARLAVRHPALRVTIRTGRSGVLVPLVRRGELDLALVPETDAGSRLHVETVGDDALGAWASPDHAVFREGLGATTPYAGLAPGPDGLPPFYRRFIRASGLSERAVIQCDSFEALRIIAARGIVVAVLPRRVAARAAGELRLVSLTKGATAAIEAGRHRLCVVSRRKESLARDVLTSEVRALLASL